MYNTIPGVYIRHSKTMGQILQEDFSTMFISFSLLDDFLEPLICLENYAEMLEYRGLRNNLLLSSSIKAFFGNKGKKLYILNYPVGDSYFDIMKFEDFLSRTCDTLMDLEVIIGIDFYEKNIYKKIFSQRDIVAIQRVVNNYTTLTNRLSITDINKDFNEKYLDVFGETCIYTPWIKDDMNLPLPPSVYVSALLSKLADEDKFFQSVANVNILNATDVDRDLTSNQIENCISNRINPIKYVPHQGIRIWGVKATNSKSDTVNELRVLKYIKRNLQRVAKSYIFEPNNENLEDKLVSQIDIFLFKLWEIGAIIGASKNEAYQLSSDLFDEETGDRGNILRINLAVSLAKPLEFIFIQLNKVDADGTQSTLSVN